MNSVCATGVRDLPAFSDVDGDGPAVCPGAGPNHCVLTEIRVSGTNLGGASFSLLDSMGGMIDLAFAGIPTDSAAALTIPASLVPGMYVLRATNAGGSADQAVEVLKGDTGAPGMNGMDGATGPTGPSGPAGPTGALDTTQVTAMNNAIDAAKVPIGTILAWHKSATGTPTLPDGWLECDGQAVFDSASPYFMGNVPDLNSTNQFLRGNSASGGSGGSPTHTHTFSQTAADLAPDASHLTNGSFTDPANHLPPHFEVVWVIRIK